MKRWLGTFRSSSKLNRHSPSVNYFVYRFVLSTLFWRPFCQLPPTFTPNFYSQLPALFSMFGAKVLVLSNSVGSSCLLEHGDRSSPGDPFPLPLVPHQKPPRKGESIQ